jgi:hypothetical protein
VEFNIAVTGDACRTPSRFDAVTVALCASIKVL